MCTDILSKSTLLSLDDILELLIENVHHGCSIENQHNNSVQIAVGDFLEPFYTSDPSVKRVNLSTLKNPNNSANTNTATSTSKYTDEEFAEARDFPSDIVVLHSRCRSDYVLDIVEALTSFQHQVTLVTSELNSSYETEAKVRWSAQWIPDSICGYFKKYLSWFKSIWMTLDIIFNPFISRPDAIFVDADPIALLVIAVFGGYKSIYIHHIENIHTWDFFHSEMRLEPDKVTWKALSCADTILVPNECIKCIVQRSYPNLSDSVEAIQPTIEVKLENEHVYEIDQVLPNYTKNQYIFVAFGFYEKSSNFELLLHVIYCIRSFMCEPIQSRIHFVIAAHCCKGVEGQKEYCKALKEKIKSRKYSNQITLITQMQITRKLRKTLLQVCRAVICPKVFDLDSRTILEAMYFKKPIIAVCCGIAQELLVHNKTAILLDNPHPMRFAEAVCKLVVDNDLCDSISNASYNYFENWFSKTSFNKNVENLLLNVKANRAIEYDVEETDEDDLGRNETATISISINCRNNNKFVTALLLARKNDANLLKKVDIISVIAHTSSEDKDEFIQKELAANVI